MHETSVKGLVYSSTYDVVLPSTNFNGLDGVDESQRYAIDDFEDEMQNDAYCISKTIAEKSVLG